MSSDIFLEEEVVLNLFVIELFQQKELLYPTLIEAQNC
ncbi:Hypothetical protein BC93_0204 [Mycoplasmopsis bovis]|nr:Hypothetical protein BC93_0204 [Mycoplasmopsis bovis]